jgi:hypothetical protein
MGPPDGIIDYPWEREEREELREWREATCDQHWRYLRLYSRYSRS